MSATLISLLEQQNVTITSLLKEISQVQDKIAYIPRLDDLLKEQERINDQYLDELKKNPDLQLQLTHNIYNLQEFIEIIKIMTRPANDSLFQKINKRIASMEASLKKGVENKEESIAKEFIEIFSLLFPNSSSINDFLHEVKKSGQAEKVYLYLESTSALMKIVRALPDDFKYKYLLFNKIKENCSLSWLKKWENGQYQASDFLTFINETTGEAVLGTVKVDTWGTQREISSGLRNVINQRARGDEFGHAALTLYIPADDRGLELIEKYCLDEQGGIKIPYEIKQYGEQLVYEIYWSFWPGRLEAQKFDRQKERMGFQYTADTSILGSIPAELREHYILKKSRNGAPIDLAPVVIQHPDSLEIDPTMQQYVQLKFKKALLNEEIASLEVLFENYLSKRENLKKKINNNKLSDSFLLLLNRFNHELSVEDGVSARICLTQYASEEDAEKLSRQVEVLLKKKKFERKTLMFSIEACSNEVQLNRVNIKKLKSCIKDLRLDLWSINEIIIKIDDFFSFLSKERNSSGVSYPLELSSETLDFLQSNNDPDISSAIESVQANKMIMNEEQLRAVSECFQRHKDDQQEKIADISLEIKDKMLDLQAEYGKHKMMVDKAISENRDELKKRVSIMDKEIQELIELMPLLPENDPDGAAKKYFGISYIKNEVTGNYETSMIKYSTKKEAEEIVLQLKKYKETLEKPIQEAIIRLELQSRRSVEDLIRQNLIRDLLGKSTVLREFNVEAMLKRASELALLASEKKGFNLVQENCSTTSMKILEAGAPTELKPLFQASKKEEGASVAENRLITNPQAVYSAARVAEDYLLGYAEAKKEVLKAAESMPHKEYFKKINQLLLKIENPESEFSKLVVKAGLLMETIAKLSPHIFLLMQDLFPKMDPKKGADSLGFLEKLAEAVKNPKTHNFDIIQSSSPIVAIHIMGGQLSSSSTAIPFFEEKTLAEVDHYILNLEAKIPRSVEEQEILKDYGDIIRERNERVLCIEHAILADTQVELALVQRNKGAKGLAIGCQKVFLPKENSDNQNPVSE